MSISPHLVVSGEIADKTKQLIFMESPEARRLGVFRFMRRAALVLVRSRRLRVIVRCNATGATRDGFRPRRAELCARVIELLRCRVTARGGAVRRNDSAIRELLKVRRRQPFAMRARCFLLRSVQKIIGSRLPSEIGSVLATKLLLRAVVAKTNFESECLAFYKRRFGPLYMAHHTKAHAYRCTLGFCPGGAYRFGVI